MIHPSSIPFSLLQLYYCKTTCQICKQFRRGVGKSIIRGFGKSENRPERLQYETGIRQVFFRETCYCCDMWGLRHVFSDFPSMVGICFCIFCTIAAFLCPQTLVWLDISQLLFALKILLSLKVFYNGQDKVVGRCGKLQFPVSHLVLCAFSFFSFSLSSVISLKLSRLLDHHALFSFENKFTCDDAVCCVVPSFIRMKRL